MRRQVGASVYMLWTRHDEAFTDHLWALGVGFVTPRMGRHERLRVQREESKGQGLCHSRVVRGLSSGFCEDADVDAGRDENKEDGGPCRLPARTNPHVELCLEW